MKPQYNDRLNSHIRFYFNLPNSPPRVSLYNQIAHTLFYQIFYESERIKK